MKIKLLCIVIVCFAAIGTVQAKKKAKKKPKADLILVEAYSQRILPGMRRPTPPPTGTYFIIVWEGAKYPETFFWRGDGGWLSCSMVKAHKIVKRSGNIPPGKDYYTENVAIASIHKGDTLQLSPVTGGKFPIPAEIPAEAKNTLFYTTGGSSWRSFHVDTIMKKRDIAMP